MTIVLLLLGLACASSCAAVRVNSVPAHIQGFAPDVPSVVAESNRARLTAAYQEEWNLRDGPPKLCLALSGGGIRSAAFSIGVMKGLEEQRPIRDFDVISAVSGGAYALGWYYAQHDSPSPGGQGSRLFSDESQQTLEKRAKFVSRPTYVGMATVDLLTIPVNLFANGLFGWHANTTPSRYWYQTRLRNTFLNRQDIPLPRLKELIATQRLPVFVINTTAYIDDDRNYYGARLSNSVFEFTPLWYGSDAFGFAREFPPDLDLARAISISGAAADSSTVAGSSQKTLASVFNQDLGFYIENLNPKVEISAWKTALPFPFYLLTRQYLRDPSGRRIYLTDGGHSENLGAYSLVRRMCARIVVVDGEHDPEYRFEAYFKLRSALRREMGVTLSVPAIDTTRLSGRWCHYNVNGRKGCDAPPTSSSPDDQWSKRVWDAPVPKPSPFLAAITAAMTGTIRGFPPPTRPADGRSDAEATAIDVTYIKLSLDPAVLAAPGRYPDVERYHRDSQARMKSRIDPKTRPSGCGEDAGYVTLFLFSCAFPQEATTDQSFSAEQFRAYRELGYGIVRERIDARRWEVRQ